jgi:hypothetical protein
MSQPPPDPKLYKGFRRGTLAVYLVFSVGFSCLVIWSVFSSVLAMTPKRPPASPDVLTLRQCALGAKAMFEELETQRKGFTTDGPAADADKRFLEFRTDWLIRERKLESECGVDQPERKQLKKAFGSLIHLVDQYTTGSVQFSGSLGSIVDDLKHELDELQ